jgi:hypothetical protein
MGTEGRKEVQDKGIGNIFNIIVAEIFTHFKKEIPLQVQEIYRTPNRHKQNEPLHAYHS